MRALNMGQYLNNVSTNYGAFFVVKIHLADDSIREYRHHVFKDIFTEIVIDLQDGQSE